MKKLKMWFSLYVILLFSGCVYSPSRTAPSSPSMGPSTTATVQPTPSVSQATSMPITSLPSGKMFTYQCLEVAASLPPAARPQGMLVLFEKVPYLLDLETGMKKALKEGQWQLKVSPDGKWVASSYGDDSGKLWLLVETADGIEQKPIPWNDDWFLLGGWLDNEHVWISHITEPLLTVVNPFTGEEQELEPDFPGLDTVAQAGEHYALGASTVLYNSSLKYAIYPRLETDGYVYVVLWDRQANRVLAKVKDVAKSYTYDPLWSPDESQVYVAVVDKWDSNKPDDFIYDFFSLNQEGRVRQLTDFGAYFYNNYIGNTSLSPDGKKIVFWLQASPSPYKDQQLAVLDLETQQVTNYCVSGWSQGNAPSPIWSLDGRYLAVLSQVEPNVGLAILVDTQEGWAAQVAELKPSGWPAGWMMEP